MYTHHIMKSAGGVDMAVIKPKFKCDAVIFMIKKMMVRCGVAHHTSRTKETAVILRKMSCPSIISKTHLRTFFPYTGTSTGYKSNAASSTSPSAAVVQIYTWVCGYVRIAVIGTRGRGPVYITYRYR